MTLVWAHKYQCTLNKNFGVLSQAAQAELHPQKNRFAFRWELIVASWGCLLHARAQT